MPDVATANEFRSIASVFERVAESKTEHDVRALTNTAPEGSAEHLFFTLACDLDNRDVPLELRSIGIFRFFLANALIQAQQLTHRYRMFAYRAIALGLREFADYFAHLDRTSSIADAPQQQKRYFAFASAQLIEMGMDMDGLLMTLKGDTADQGDSYEVRRLREEGPDAFKTTHLFDDREKELWTAMFDAQAPEAVTALQQYLVKTYEVPFLAAPPEQTN